MVKPFFGASKAACKLGGTGHAMLLCCLGSTVLLLSSASEVAAQSLGGGYGSQHTLGIRYDGAVAAWGFDQWGQASGATGVNGVTAVSAGFTHSLALRSNGTIAAWGDNAFNQVTHAGTVTNATAISAGNTHSLALLANGTVAAWGNNNHGQVSNAASVTNAQAIAAGGEFSLALRADGSIAAWGNNNSHQVSGAASIHGVSAISAGNLHGLALRSNGTVAAWGSNAQGQSTLPVPLTNATAVSAGYLHSIALRSNGTVAAWGLDHAGQVSGAGAISNAVYVVAAGHHNYAVLSNGTITSWGENVMGQRNTPNNFLLPFTVEWSSATSGDYLNSHLWNGRIPSTAHSEAKFSAAGAYAVGFGNTAMSSKLSINAGDVTFNLGTHQYVTGNMNVSSGATFQQNGYLYNFADFQNHGTYVASQQSTVVIGNIFSNYGTLVNNGTFNGLELYSSHGSLVTGSGHFNNNVIISDDATLAPGNSIGLMTGKLFRLSEDGKFEFEIGSANGVMGTDWDGLELSSQLWINSTVANPFQLKLSSMGILLHDFDASQDYEWAFAVAAGGIQSFSADKFTIDSSGFLNDLAGGSFYVSQNGNNLVLGFSAVPEPSALMLVGTVCAGVLLRRHRAALP